MTDGTTVARSTGTTAATGVPSRSREIRACSSSSALSVPDWGSQSTKTGFAPE